MFKQFYVGKKVFVTGHTGFKGTWLTQWLVELGAEVTGYSLPLSDENRFFTQVGLNDSIRSIYGDIADQDALHKALTQTEPDVVFHLAAQPLVRLSYEQPVSTYTTNVTGTLCVLDALRSLDKACAAIFVTTDKVYENQEWLHAYRETDRLGGYDPYSSSKACAEIAIASFRRSFFSFNDRAPVSIATARAGNVMGGGDWAADRIIPDCIRALLQNSAIPVRNKVSTRPWQHVLEPLSGYLHLAAHIHPDHLHSLPTETRELLLDAFNFAPSLESNRTVQEVVEELLKSWPGRWEDHTHPDAAHEAGRLNLSIDKSYHLLGWQPIWNFAETIQRTVFWYRDAVDHLAASKPVTAIRERTMADIKTFAETARQHQQQWTE